MVDEFVSKVNAAVRHQEEVEKVKSVIQRLATMCVVHDIPSGWEKVFKNPSQSGPTYYHQHYYSAYKLFHNWICWPQCQELVHRSNWEHWLWRELYVIKKILPRWVRWCYNVIAIHSILSCTDRCSCLLIHWHAINNKSKQKVTKSTCYNKSRKLIIFGLTHIASYVAPLNSLAFQDRHTNSKAKQRSRFVLRCFLFSLA